MSNTLGIIISAKLELEDIRKQLDSFLKEKRQLSIYIDTGAFGGAVKSGADWPIY